MAIISFWNPNNSSTGRTTALLSMATYLTIQHKYKILVIDTSFNSYSIKDSFWVEKKQSFFKQNKSQIELGTGINSLSRAILSNKISPETITNYTKIVFNRFEVLTDTKISREEYDRNKKIFKQIAKTADKYYDIVLIDVDKNLDEDIVEDLLELSKIIVVPMKQNLRELSTFLNLKEKYKEKYTLMPLLSMYDSESKFSYKKVTKYFKEKQEVLIIPYNTKLMEVSSEGKLADFFIENRKMNDKNINSILIQQVKMFSEAIISKLKELQTRI